MTKTKLAFWFRGATPILFTIALAASALVITAAQARGGRAASAPQAAIADPAHAPGSWDKLAVYRMSDPSVNDAGFRAASATLNQIDAIFSRVPALSPPPTGVLILMKPTVGRYDTWDPREFPYRRDAVPMRYTVIILHPTLYCPNGQCRVDRGEGPGFALYINTPHMLLGRPITQGPELWYAAPRSIGQVAGFPLYELFDGQVVLTKRTQPIWLPVTQEEWVQRKLREAQQYPPPPYAGPEIQQRYKNNLSKMEQELARLSPQERRAPAYCCGATPLGETPLPAGLSKPAELNARMVVRLNKDFFDPNLPANAPQIIIFGGNSSFSWTDAGDQKLRAHASQLELETSGLFTAIRKDLDWKALFALLQ